jgi:6-pyruvoyltetrahydropterin/6-carboxytetrahydropterin synthase
VGIALFFLPKTTNVSELRMYLSTKTYAHEEGLSCSFRQWRAKNSDGSVSNCTYNHGYAISVKFVFSSESLDSRNWVVAFGDLKETKAWLHANFDHKTLIAEDDPELEYWKEGHKRSVLDLLIIPHVGCEKFAEYIYKKAPLPIADDVYLDSVEVREHGGNSAVFMPEGQHRRLLSKVCGSCDGDGISRLPEDKSPLILCSVCGGFGRVKKDET